MLLILVWKRSMFLNFGPKLDCPFSVTLGACLSVFWLEFLVYFMVVHETNNLSSTYHLGCRSHGFYSRSLHVLIFCPKLAIFRFWGKNERCDQKFCSKYWEIEPRLRCVLTYKDSLKRLIYELLLAGKDRHVDKSVVG